MAEKTSANLSKIKDRLRTGKMTKADLKKISTLITQAEKAAKALRAAVVE